MPRIALFLSLALVALPSASAADKRAFTIEDLYRVATPTSLDLSSDGRQVVYALTSYDLGRATSNSDLYVVPLEGGPARRLTWTDDVRESSPRWSPDGSQIAFVARRGAHEQVWLLPARGGEARPLTDVSTGVAHPTWSPDGRSVAFESRVLPACGADEACNRRHIERRAGGPLRAHVADELLFRHWDTWKEGRVTHVLAVDVESGEVVDLTPGSREAPAHAIGRQDFDLGPGRGTLAYTRNPDPLDEAAWSTNADVWLATRARKGEGQGTLASNLSVENEAGDVHPRFSPDGRLLAWLRQAIPGYESDLRRLVVLDLESGTVRELTPDFDDQIDDFAWDPGSESLVFRAQVRGETPLYRVSLDGGPAEVARFAQLDAYALAPDGRTAVAVQREVGRPPEIWRLDLEGASPPVRLTTHNAELEAEVDLRPAERLAIPVGEGREVEVFLVKPHGFDPARRYPLILNVHGGPQYQWADAFRGDWQVYTGQGYVVAFPNPTGSTGYGHAYTRAISGDYGGRVFEELMAVTDALAELAWIDEERIGAMGWSWGGYMMNWFQARAGERFRCLASMMGLFDLRSMWGATEELWFPEWDFAGLPWESPDYERWSPSTFAGRFGTPMLIVTGQRDYRVPYTQSLQAFTTLRRQGVPARLIVLPEAGHWPGWYEMALYYTAHLEWFERWLGGGGAPWTTEAFANNAVFDRETGNRVVE